MGLTASDLSVFVGGRTATFGPSEIQPNCPQPGHKTVFIVDKGAGGTGAMVSHAAIRSLTVQITLNMLTLLISSRTLKSQADNSSKLLQVGL